MVLPLVWLADVLRDAGLEVIETQGWKERSTNDDSPLPTDPVGVLVHHTASPSSQSNPAPTVQMCINGRPDLEGPLCHVVIGHDGVCHTIAAGRANHAGEARESGPIPSGDGNSMLVGFEMDYDGVNRPSAAQYKSTVTATRAVLDRLDLSHEHARAHKETSTTGKIDPGYVDMDKFRFDVANSGGDEDDLTPEQDAILRRMDHELFGPRDDEGNPSGWNTPIGPRTMVAMMISIIKALYEPQKSRVPDAESEISVIDAIRNTDAAVYQQGETKVSAREIAKELKPEIQDAISDALGDEDMERAEKVIDALSKRLSGDGPADDKDESKDKGKDKKDKDKKDD